MLVIAGAGTGKTTVLTQRIAQLIRSGNARADEILALTYTDNAARQMRERVQDELGPECRVQAMTFHAYCFGLLKRCGKDFGVLDDKDLWIMLRRRIPELGLKYFVRAANVSKFLDDLLDFMRRCQDELVGPAKYAEYVEKLQRGELPLPRVAKSKDADQLSREELLGRCREIASVFERVEGMLAEQSLGTFAHMITRTYELLAGDRELVVSERAGARFILVDEFQDANFAQVKILEHLGGEDRNIFAVGDPDQAIYRFRGASSAAFALFESQFPGGKAVSLLRNQRSLSPILRCAHAVIAQNPPSLSFPRAASKPSQRPVLESAREIAAQEAGTQVLAAPVESVLWRDRELEAADVVRIIREKRRSLRVPYSKFAILYRTHIHRDDVVEELTECKIPYAIEGLDVLDTAEVRDLLACLGAVVSVNDSASLFRVSALPQFAIDPENLRQAMKSAERNAPLAAILERVEGGPQILVAIGEAREEIAKRKANAGAALNILLKRFALPESSAMQGFLSFVDAWEKKPITRTAGAGEFLEYLQYFREARGSIPVPPQSGDAVQLMTAHAAKGLEFDHVFIIRANTTSFPCGYREPLFDFPRELRDKASLVEQEDKQLHEEEERRLFYVAMTRARDSLTIYAKQGKGKDVTPPGYVRELLHDRTLADVLRRRNARPLQADLFGEGAVESRPSSVLNSWLALNPLFRLSHSLSATAIELYKICPLQFKLEREWRIPGEVPAAMQYGASIHRVLRTYYDAIRFNRPLSDEAVIEQFRDDLNLAGLDDPYQHELYERQGIEQLRNFLAEAHRNPPVQVLETEQEFKIKIGEATVVGRIDRIDSLEDSRVAIVDYKTGKPRLQEDADESLQLSIYAIAAHKMWNYRVERLAFSNLENNSVVASTRTPAQLEEAKATIEDVGGKIAQGKFDPTPGFHCNFCAYRNLCPATEKRLPDTAAKSKAARIN